MIYLKSPPEDIPEGISLAESEAGSLAAKLKLIKLPRRAENSLTLLPGTYCVISEFIKSVASVNEGRL